MIPEISEIFSKREKTTLKKSNEIIYKSKLYKELENEKNKTWYYSNKALAEFLIEEYETGKLDISEV
ncbi:MAG: hypothetical protein FWC47_13060 [Oscillospiraceae bacterium]|nr:hypothetical protein [Oscillospiraceae bacterium]